MNRDMKLGNEPVMAENEKNCRFEGYFTYRPLSNLPTPPPSSRNSSAAQSPRTTLDDGEPLMPRFRDDPSRCGECPASLLHLPSSHPSSDSRPRAIKERA
uniref:Uncharacterized protein n=1 Tax=Gibberella zeae TaxID=5518 RepID=A0A4E9EM55_GIBZA